MAAAWSSGARGFSGANVASLATAAFTISGSDRYLEVLTYSGATTPQNVSGVVWDAAGVNEALSLVETHITFGTNFRVSKWALLNPTAGTSKTVTATWASNQDETMVIADAYTGIHQTTPTRTRPTPANATGSTPTLSVTSVADDLVVGAVAGSTASASLTTVTSSAVTVRESVSGTDLGGYESCGQGDVTATGTSTSVGFTLNNGGGTIDHVLFGVALIPSAGASPTTTIVSGSATAAVGIAETYTYTLDASPAGTVTVTPTAPVAGSWSPTTVGLTSGNWNTGLTSNFTASAVGSGNISSTNDGGLTNDTQAVTVYSTSRPSAVTPNTWTDEAGGSLVVADINDASDSTGAKDPSGASYPVLAFTMDTPMAASVAQTCYFRGNDVTAGKQTRQILFATDGTTVVATGAWKTMTGTLATYSDVLTPTATAYKGEIQTQASAGGAYALEFPSNISGSDTTAPFVALQFSNPQSNGLPIWGDSNNGVTVVWKIQSSQQTGYYAMFWWSRADGAFSGTDGYWGFHPYPQNQANTGTTHWWEVAVNGGDFIDYQGFGPGAGSPKTVVYDTTFTQGIRVTRGGVNSKTLRSYNALPSVANADVIEAVITTASYGETSPTTPKVTIGDSPWYAGYQHERFSGILDSIKIFNNVLSEADMLDEAADFSQVVTAAGASSIWFGKNGFDDIDDLTCDFGTSRTFVWADTSNKGTLVARL